MRSRNFLAVMAAMMFSGATKKEDIEVKKRDAGPSPSLRPFAFNNFNPFPYPQRLPNQRQRRKLVRQMGGYKK